MWMTTFSDLVTLLLTFFVLLLSMANMDEVKFGEAASSLRGAFGIMGGKEQKEIAKPAIVELAPVHDDLVQRIYKRMKLQMNRLRLDPKIEIVKDRGAIILRVNEAILFPPGDSRLRAESHQTLRDVSAMIRPLPLEMRIEGHTDNTSLTSSGMSNWDLSVARSVAVLKFFDQENLIPLDRMSAVGYGAEKPIAPNDTKEGRSLNRRVEFVLESSGDYRQDLPYLIDARKQSPF